ncbi:hypothetical protein PIB30_005883 [Stylosanthes scabra]|uniref:Uncharacterized protein n=1 Tax=Stylosanthes scabra TaxID=79078 RepID=A0ABU6Q435_9FABA|nr:hypothetical protein [Stylosanthes scabra]
MISKVLRTGPIRPNPIINDQLTWPIESRIEPKEERFDTIMKRSYPNLNHPLLYKQGATPPQGESSPDPNTPLKEMNPSIQNVQQLETPLRELLERQTREEEIASDAMKRANEGDETGDSRSRTWKPSTVIGKPPAKENSKHPF